MPMFNFNFHPQSLVHVCVVGVSLCRFRFHLTSVRNVQFLFLYALHCLNFSSLGFFRLHCGTLKVILIALFINCFLGHTVPLTAD